MTARRSPRLGLALGLAALAGIGAAQAGIAVGGKPSAEQRLLAAMTTHYLDAQGYDVTKRGGMGSVVLRRAQRNGQVDVAWADVATALFVHNEVDGAATLSPKAAYNKVRTLDAEQDLVWLQATDARTGFALAMREADAAAKGIERLGELVELQKTGGGLSLGVTSAWAGRPDGLVQFQAGHDIRWPRDKLRRLKTDRVHEALIDGTIDVGVVSTTDGRIAAADVRVLDDATDVLPNAAIAPVVRRDALAAHPALREHLNSLGETLDTAALRRLTRLAGAENASVASIAELYLQEQGLI